MGTAHTTVNSDTDSRTSNKLSLLPLSALVVGSMIGGGVFSLPHGKGRFAWRRHRRLAGHRHRDVGTRICLSEPFYT